MPRNGFRKTMACATAVVVALSIGAGSEELARRRQRVEQMTPAQQAELIRKQGRFNALSDAKKDLLRELHRRLDEEPDGQALREVLWRYCEWLDTLIPYTRNELEKLPVENRVAGIKQKRSGGQDVRALREWGEAHLARLGLTPARLEQEMWKQFHSRDSGRKGRPPKGGPAESLVKHFRLEEADLTSLAERLSPVTREQFNKLSAVEQRRWVARAMISSIRPSRPPEVVNDQTLAEFFESNALSDAQREELLKLPGDEMRGALMQLYRRMNARRFPGGGPGRRGPDFERRIRRFPPPEGPPGEPPDPIGERRDHRRPDRPEEEPPTRAPEPGR
ncbi:MAG TPA: hypothetical protein VJL29_08750 [Thermoguttaceae bacterium]|nr:hypothetical protein [Thermoguttaceae bacterium]